MVGLGLDGACAMSGKFKRVQAWIRELYPMVHYTHCSSHNLNLAIGKLTLLFLEAYFLKAAHEQKHPLIHLLKYKMARFFALRKQFFDKSMFR